MLFVIEPDQLESTDEGVVRMLNLKRQTLRCPTLSEANPLELTMPDAA